MFDVVRNEINSRILINKRILALLATFEQEKPIESATFKGLMFVHLYGIYEYSVNSAVQAVLAAIRADRLSPQDLCHSSLTLLLNPWFMSLSGVGRAKMWKKRMDLVASFESITPLESLDDTLFPTDGSHYRVGQLETIWEIFGISLPVVPEPRLRQRIDELVDNRNAIAHGRSTPEEIGGRFSSSEIQRRVEDIQKIASYVVTTIETHYKNGGMRR